MPCCVVNTLGAAGFGTGLAGGGLTGSVLHDVITAKQRQGSKNLGIECMGELIVFQDFDKGFLRDADFTKLFHLLFTFLLLF